MSPAHRQDKKRFSLKDELFNKSSVRTISTEIKNVYPDFNQVGFEEAVLSGFKRQELMDRVRGIRDQLRAFLPKSYPTALGIILEALPPELDPNKEDNDFGEFIYASYGYFVATYGCTEKHVDLSLQALEEITKRFSVERALRDFLNSFPTKTLVAVERWSKSDNYHVRRLASEGTRPYLPWAKQIQLSPQKFVPILNRLHADPTRYVVRSVANHVNDLSKIVPAGAVALVEKWQNKKLLSEKDSRFLLRHALRTLIKEGNKTALQVVGYGSTDFRVENFKLKENKVKIGQTLSFSFDIRATTAEEQALLIDYKIYFLKANGDYAIKTFKISEKKLSGKEVLTMDKSHAFVLMSTRALYTGVHYIELQINGRASRRLPFQLTAD